MKATKRLLALAMSAAMVFSAMPLVGAQDNYQEGDAAHDDFESATVGAIPTNGGYVWWTANGEEANHTVAISNEDIGGNTTNKLQAGRDALVGGLEVDLPMTINRDSGKFVYEFKMYATSFGAEWGFRLDDDAYSKPMQWSFNKGPAVYRHDESDARVGTSASLQTNTWYRVSWVMDFTGDSPKQSLYFDGVPAFVDQPLTRVSNARCVKFSNSLGAYGEIGTFYFDDFVLYDYDEERVIGDAEVTETPWWVPADFEAWNGGDSFALGSSAYNDNGVYYFGEYNAEGYASNPAGDIAYNVPDPTNPENMTILQHRYSDDLRWFFYLPDGLRASMTSASLGQDFGYQLRIYMPSGNTYPFRVYAREENTTRNGNAYFFSAFYPQDDHYVIRLGESGQELAEINADQWYVMGYNMRRVESKQVQAGSAMVDGWVWEYDVYLDGQYLATGTFETADANLHGVGFKTNVYGDSGAYLEGIPTPESHEYMYTDDYYFIDGSVPRVAVEAENMWLSGGVGTSDTLSYTVFPEGSQVDNVTFVSNNDDIATVDQSGVVTATGLGRTTIDIIVNDGAMQTKALVTVGDVYPAIYEESVSAESSVESNGDTTVTLTSTLQSMTSQSYVTFVAAVVDANGNVVGDVTTSSQTITANGSVTYTTPEMTIASGSGQKVVLFAWDGLDTMSPYTYVLEYDANGWV